MNVSTQLSPTTFKMPDIPFPRVAVEAQMDFPELVTVNEAHQQLYQKEDEKAEHDEGQQFGEEVVLDCTNNLSDAFDSDSDSGENEDDSEINKRKEELVELNKNLKIQTTSQLTYLGNFEAENRGNFVENWKNSDNEDHTELVQAHKNSQDVEIGQQQPSMDEQYPMTPYPCGSVSPSSYSDLMEMNRPMNETFSGEDMDDSDEELDSDDSETKWNRR